jgi:cyclic beta-1,2-glucan synthetase
MLWLPYVTAAYVRATGDASVLDESIAFLKERALTASDEDLFGTPAVSDERASLYEHCTRALDVGTTAGTHDLPLMGSGDWNDGMNRVGRLGKGESVWLAWFLGATLSDFTAIAEKRGDRERVQRCKDQIARLAKAVDTSGWDGAWYRRAFFDDGTPLGSSTNDECRIDAIAQSWAVISGIGDPARARDAVHASLTELVHPTARLMRLLWPPFDRTAHDPGYIRAYPNGVRENGGQYTHGVLWTVRALTMLGEGDAAMRLWSMIDPARHASSPEGVARYRVEPYVVAADVYEAKNHVGRGGWTWYTGSAGWMYRVALEDILGVRRVGDRIEIAPCIPRAWKRFEVSYGSVHVVVENPRGVERGIARFEIDGEASAARTAPLDGKKHEVLVVMG